MNRLPLELFPNPASASSVTPKRMISERCQSRFKLRRLNFEEENAIEPKNSPQSEPGSGSNSKEDSQRLSAKSQLHKLCFMRHWKEPKYDCRSEGPRHKQLFTATVTVEIKEGSEITTLECFGETQYKKKMATDRAAEAALWCLNKMGHS